MSYRSFKRVLGETSLERKCRILFGISLLLLLTAAFWYAGWNAEQLVKEAPRLSGQFFVQQQMQSYHYAWFADGDERFKQNARSLYKTFSTEGFEWEILVLNDEGIQDGENARTRKARDEEIAILAELRRKLDASFELWGRERLLEESDDADFDPEKAALEDELSPFKNPVFHLELAEDEDSLKNYHYYQPVLWQSSCTTSGCHNNMMYRPAKGKEISRYAFSYEEWLQKRDWYDEQNKPDDLRVVKVVLPSQETHSQVMRTRGILIALAIGTVFLSMIALYAVVRYVIVKPLNHLRDVSDEISRGNYDLRANIQTRDEFEDLAASFNRMLRHLVDAQGELRSLNTDLDAKVDQLAQANMQLHEMNRVKSDFLSSMSHELRTPLNSIIGFADVLRESQQLNDKQKRYAGNIGKSGRSLLEMINDILDLAKAESGKMEVRLSEFYIDPVVNSQCELVRSLSEEKNIDLTTKVEKELPPLYQDQGKIQQILTNLLSNAIKFTPEGGRIVVTARRDPMRHLVLSVEDTGVGIAEEERRVIFEKFRQGTQTVGSNHLTRKFSGSGLGLSIVKELSRLLGGEVSFDSELGKGSTFHVRVPWTLADQPKADVSIQQRLDEVTKPRPLDLGATKSRLEASSSDPTSTDTVAKLPPR